MDEYVFSAYFIAAVIGGSAGYLIGGIQRAVRNIREVKRQLRAETTDNLVRSVANSLPFFERDAFVNSYSDSYRNGSTLGTDDGSPRRRAIHRDNSRSGAVTSVGRRSACVTDETSVTP